MLPSTKLFRHGFEQSCSAMSTQKLEEKVQQHDEVVESSKSGCRSQSRAHGTASEQVQALIVSCNALQHTATHCNTLQHTATHCNTLQHIECLHSSATPMPSASCSTLQHTATHCNALQHTATHCNTLQHTATHCHTLPHTAASRAQLPFGEQI